MEFKKDLKFYFITFQYNVGDFVLVDSKGRSSVHQIFRIENMFTSKDGVQNMYANQVLSCPVFSKFLWDLIAYVKI